MSHLCLAHYFYAVSLPNREPAPTRRQAAKRELERQTGYHMSTSFILRLIWDRDSQLWRIVLKPTSGGPPHVFVDLETAFLYIARFYTDHVCTTLLYTDHD